MRKKRESVRKQPCIRRFMPALLGLFVMLAGPSLAPGVADAHLADASGFGWFAHGGICSLAVSFNPGKSGPVSGADPDYILFNDGGKGEFNQESLNREFVFDPQVMTDGVNILDIMRRVYVPAGDTFCRWLNVFTNNGQAAVTFNAIISNQSASGQGAVWASSDGDAQASTTDTWVATAPVFFPEHDAARSFSFILQGDAAAVPVSAVHFYAADSHWTYRLTLQPGQSGMIMNVASLQPGLEASAAKAAALLHNPAPVLKYMTADEAARILNFCPPYTVEVKSDGKGHTDKDGFHTVLPGAEFSVKAFPDPGYTFKKWTGSVCCSDNPLTVTVDCDMVICAYFKNDPPKVTIDSPDNCATVKGSVNIQATATDDSGVTKLDFIIDGITKAAVSAPPFQYTWNTVAFSFGNHTIKAVAYDQPGLSCSKEISVKVQNVTLNVSGKRHTEKSWLKKQKPVNNLEIRIDNPYNAPVTKLVVERKSGDGKYQAVKEILVNALLGKVYTFSDTKIESDKKYTYKATALDNSGNVLSQSAEKCL